MQKKMQCTDLSIQVRESDQKVWCSVCEWVGKLSDCNFGHDDYFCPNCGKEGGLSER
jgi:predicted RNA-binding Zn-ribbon protein involved in translation (DUF1610 family)